MRTFHLTLVAAASVAFLGVARAQGDDCTGALSVGQGLNGPFTNVGSTTSAPGWPCGAGANDVWFSYIPPQSGSLTADTCTGTAYDSTIEVFDGTGGCGGLVSLACNDDSCGLQSSVTVAVAGGTTYFIRVGGFGGGTGTFSLNINGPLGTLLATVVNQGAGCLAQYTSFYELFATAAAFDLASSAITLSPAGGGYVVLSGGVYNPVGSLGAPVTLALTDDLQVAAGTLGLVVGSNGWVATGGGNSNGFVPTITTLLGNTATAFYSWHDMNPTIAGSGTVKYEEAGTLAQVTFDGVWDFAGTSVADANNVQFQINTATGACTICWGAMSTLGASGTGHLVGYSPAGASANPGGSDLSTSLPLIVSSADLSPLTLSSLGRPVQGASAAAFNVTTSNIPAGALIHAGVLGLSAPGLPVPGAPGCFFNASLDVILGTVILPPTSVTWTALNLPAAPPWFLGFPFHLQGVALGVAANSAYGVGVLASNGLTCTIGDF